MTLRSVPLGVGVDGKSLSLTESLTNDGPLRCFTSIDSNKPPFCLRKESSAYEFHERLAG